MALWTVHGDGRPAPGADVDAGERVSWPLTVGLGVQHLAAMFAATIMVPALTGLPPTTTLLFSGVGTLLFLLLTRNRVPAYLGSSFAFVAPLTAARSEGVPAQLGGVLFAGLLLVVVGIGVKALGVRLLESVMPPVVSGAVIMLVGLGIVPFAATGVGRQPLFAAVTLAVTALCAVLGRGLLARIGVLLGIFAGWLVAAMFDQLDHNAVLALHQAAWFGMPTLQEPQLRPPVMMLVVPAVLVLVAQNVAHVKAIGVLTRRDLNGNIGDVLIADGVATTLAGAGGGSALTTFGANVGVMTVTKVFSTAAYVVAALGAVVLAFSPKFTALINTVPAGVVGGASLVLFGTVAMIGVRTWLENDVDLTDPINLLIGGAAVAAAVSNVTVTFGSLQFTGIVWGSLLIVLGHPLLRRLRATGD
ncbi:MAG TPA: solute carrier family 23 protein [Pseudonocardiaceae bacterium]|nr:solute carrier family 23 protein [Pseudonocardiaceae bacterium]